RHFATLLQEGGRGSPYIDRGRTCLPTDVRDVGKQCLARGVAIFHAHAQATLHYTVHLPRQLRTQLRWRCVPPLEYPFGKEPRRHPFKGRTTREHLVEHYPESPDVRSWLSAP